MCVYVFPRGTQHAVQCDVAAGNALIRLGLGQHLQPSYPRGEHIRTVRLPAPKMGTQVKDISFKKWRLRINV